MDQTEKTPFNEYAYFCAYRLLTNSQKNINYENMQKILSCVGIKSNKKTLEDFVLKQTTNIPSPKEITTITPEGLKLTITEDSSRKPIINLEEDIESFDVEKISKIKFIFELIKTFGEVCPTNIEYFHGEEGEERIKKIDLRIKNISNPTNLKCYLLKQINLYKNLIKTLHNKINAFPKIPNLITRDIKFYTHMQPGRKSNLAEITYFLRELYGIIKIQTGSNEKELITRKNIISNKKDRKTCKERDIVIFILRTKFSRENYDKNYLSTPEIGKILNKDHATILLALKKFDKTDLNLDFYKTATTSDLYEDAEKRYINNNSIRTDLNKK